MMQNRTPSASSNNVTTQGESIRQRQRGEPHDQSGLYMLLKKTESSEKVPNLDKVFEQTLLKLDTKLHKYNGMVPDIQGYDVSSLIFKDFPESVKQNALLVLVNIKNLKCPCVVVLRENFINSYLEILMGGKSLKGSSSYKRKLTGVERDMLRYFVEVFLEALGESFEIYEPFSFELERLETNYKYITIFRHMDVVTRSSFNMYFEDQAATLDIFFPHESIERIKSVIESDANATVVPQYNKQWARELTSQAYHIPLHLVSYVDEFKAMLSDVASWREGTTLELSPKAIREITLKTEGVPLFTGQFGHANGAVAFKITNNINEE